MAKKSAPPTLTTVADVVKAFGGPKQMADWAGVRTSSISNWKSWGFIPPAWHYRMAVELRMRGFEVEPGVFGVDLNATGRYKARRVA